jgi:hypothetical protein
MPQSTTHSTTTTNTLTFISVDSVSPNEPLSDAESLDFFTKPIFSEEVTEFSVVDNSMREFSENTTPESLSDPPQVIHTPHRNSMHEGMIAVTVGSMHVSPYTDMHTTSSIFEAYPDQTESSILSISTVESTPLHESEQIMYDSKTLELAHASLHPSILVTNPTPELPPISKSQPSHVVMDLQTTRPPTDVVDAESLIPSNGSKAKEVDIDISISSIISVLTPTSANNIVSTQAPETFQAHQPSAPEQPPTAYPNSMPSLFHQGYVCFIT